MNAPYAEFLRGAEPGEPIFTRPEVYSGRIIIFEADRRFEPMADLSQRVLKWKRKRGLSPDDGHIHPIEFPELSDIDAVAWTPFRAFQFRVPNDQNRPPSRRVFFTSSRALIKWKRQYWKEMRLPADYPFMVHASCHHPSGERLVESRLLTF